MRYMLMIAAALCLLLSSAAFADEIVFKNGDRTKGKVTQFTGGKMTVVSDTMGKVPVDLKDVATFSTENPIKIHFADGSVFNQKILAAEEGAIIIEKGPSGTPLKCQISEIKKINPPPVKWTGNVSAGVSITRGNSYNENANATMEAVRRSENDRISFEAGYASSRQKDPDTDELSTTQRASYLGLQYDLFFTKKVYGYAKARAERDAIARVDMRFLGGVGAGWQVVEQDDFNFSAEAGLSWISENEDDYMDVSDPLNPVYVPDDDTDYLSARVAYHVDKKFNTAVDFFHNAEWYPGFEASGGHLVNADGGIRSSLTESMFTEFKVLWTWDSTPAEDKKRTDVVYLFSLGWSF